MNSLCTNSNHATSVDVSTYCVQHQANHSPAVVNVQKTISKRVTHLFKAAAAYIRRKYYQRIDRQAFNYLLTLDDALLKDIGVTKQDVVYASNLPLCTDASAVLETIAKRR